MSYDPSPSDDGPSYNRGFDDGVATGIERTLKRIHEGDQWRDGGNHPNSSVERCGLCARIREGAQA